jgi:hypothetical protein
MPKNIAKSPLLFIEGAAVGLICLAIWLDEIFDLPHLLFDLPATDINWGDALIECFFVCFVGALLMALTWRLGPGSPKKEPVPVVTVCAVCQKVNKGGEWIALDKFIEAGSSGAFTHGICPDCMETYYRGVTDTTALNFRQILKKPKS